MPLHSVPPNTAPTTSLGPMPTPTYGPGGSFTIACSTSIAASPLRCLDVVIRASDYPTWNTFCRKCTIDAQPVSPTPIPGLSTGPPDAEYLHLGTYFTFDVHLNLAAPKGATGRPTSMEVSVLERIDEEGRKGWRVAWKQRPSLMMPSWMMHGERIQEFVEAGEAQTEYTCWETFYGALAPVVRMTVAARVMDGFKAWMAGLKKRAEEQEKEAAASS